MIPVKAAIESGAWLHCHRDEDVWSDQEFNLRIRVLSFEKVRIAEVDNPEKLEFLNEGIYWIMKVEAVSLVKAEIRPRSLTDSIIVIDQDGFSFNVIRDDHLVFYSDYAKKSGLSRFFATELRPKIKVKGAFAFLLPDDDSAKYSIAIEEGTITEV